MDQAADLRGATAFPLATGVLRLGDSLQEIRVTHDSRPAPTTPMSQTTRAEARRRRAEAQETIHRAVALLRHRHQVQEASAYTMLVQASVDQRLSVRATAARMIEESRDIPSPRS